MKTEQKLRDFTLRLIQILVWFEILWAVVFLAGMVFQWSGLTDQLSEAFFGSGFCVILVLAALAMLNVSVNLNIISKVQVSRVAGAEVLESKPGSFIKTLAVAGALIGLVVLSLWFAEWRLYQTKASDTETRIESIIDTPLLDEAITLIANDGRAVELYDVREALASAIQADKNLSFIIPRKVKGATVYYEFTAGWYDEKKDEKKISQASLTKFVPYKSELRKWDRLISGQINSFTGPCENSLRTFRRVTKNEQEVILLIDTARRYDYQRGSFGK